MAVVNRTLDVSEQRKVFSCEVPRLGGASFTNVPTGNTSVVCVVPYPCTLDAMQLVVYGLSGSPTYQLNVDRFIVGTGFTTMILATGSSNPGRAFGTSGVAAGVIAASGSTLLNLQANDSLVLTTGGSGAAADQVFVSVVLKPLQDIKLQFGV